MRIEKRHWTYKTAVSIRYIKRKAASAMPLPVPIVLKRWKLPRNGRAAGTEAICCGRFCARTAALTGLPPANSPRRCRMPAIPLRRCWRQSSVLLPRGGLLVRRRVPDLTAVELTHRFLRSTLAPGGLYLDATCGNGHDTLFLCSVAGENGRVIGLDIQPQAAANTNALLAANGMAAIGRAECCDHRELLRFAPPGSADCVMFNFGWLPGAAHDVHSTADSTLPALQAGLDALKPGGVLAAVLYSGKVIGNAEKKAAAEFFRSLPLADYTVLICEFANWADTAPLPCFVIKREK